MAMKCSEFKSAVECAIEQRTPIDSCACEHISLCADCRRIWAYQQRVDAAIIAWQACRPPAPPVEAVLAKLACPSIEHDHEFTDISGDFEISNRIPSNWSGTREGLSRTRARSQFLAIASCLICLLSFFVFHLNRFPSTAVPQSAGHGQISQNENSKLARADSSDDLTTELSNLVDELRTQIGDRDIETAKTSFPVTINASPSERARSNHDSTPNQTEKRDMSQVVEPEHHPLFSRLKRGFGFLSQGF